MTDLLIVLALLASHALLFAAGGWHLRWRAYRHQMRATRTAITDPQHRADATAWHRRRLWYGLPRFHPRSAR